VDKISKIVLAARSDYCKVDAGMNKTRGMKKLIICLAIALGLISIGMVTGCKQQSETPTTTPEMTNTPSTNAASTNAM
jgi:uncharacterized lipoprotein YajG